MPHEKEQKLYEMWVNKENAVIKLKEGNGFSHIKINTIFSCEILENEPDPYKNLFGNNKLFNDLFGGFKG